jgi:phenylalanyl-tRNA synthetase alpha chain
MKLIEVKFAKIEKQMLDPTVETVYELGKLHLITEEINLVKLLMERHGFQHVEGPIIDNEYYNFDALNVQKMHPARGEHDTFYLRSGNLLRTHCSSVEMRALEGGVEKGTKRMFHVGRVYRRDDDRTHSTMFHQVEGIYVDSFNLVTFAHLKWFVRNLVQDLLMDQVKLRFRSGYFPFTEPSMEIDVLTETTETGSIRFVREGEKIREGKWMEVLGSGMLCQNILKRAGYTEHTAFAFGLGIDRIVMLKHGISNINDLYKNRFPFLRKYSIEGGLE